MVLNAFGRLIFPTIRKKHETERLNWSSVDVSYAEEELNNILCTLDQSALQL